MHKAILFFSIMAGISSQAQTGQYTMPFENTLHEGTWLQWPHNHHYGPWYRDDLTPTFAAMTSALQSGEKVHVIAYDSTEFAFIATALNTAGVPLNNVDFHIYPSDDVWARDNGPMFVYDSANNLKILDWGFNGWGLDAPYALDDTIPQLVAAGTGIPSIDLSAMVLEGGAVEHDGNGTLIATRSSVTNPSRNPLLNESQIENYLSTYMGISHFIWLDGVYGQEITDQHIDGFVKFANDSTIVTMNNPDLLYWQVLQADIDTLYAAVNTSGKPYHFVYLPLTQNNVVTAYGNNLGYKGSYINYYVGNDVVLVPAYNDPNDSIASNIIGGLYPNRTAIGIDVRNLYEYGGMIHCVTQQQPVDLNTNIKTSVKGDDWLLQINPNPFNASTTISFRVHHNTSLQLDICDIKGQIIRSFHPSENTQTIVLDKGKMKSGVYICVLKVNGRIEKRMKMIID